MHDEMSLLLKYLASADPRDRVAILKTLVEDPSGDARIVSAIEPLLEDRTVSILSIPLLHGEVRWLAAHALAAEARAAGVKREVRLEGVPHPLSTFELSELAARTYGDLGARSRPEEQFERLRQDGHLPARDLVLSTENTRDVDGRDEVGN